MIRLAGAALLAAGSGLLGLCAVHRLDGRVWDLRQLILGLETMIRELDYRLAPLPELLERAAAEAEGEVSQFFSLSARGASHLNGRTFQAVWRQAAEAAQLRLDQTDMALLEQLGGVLGRYDGESQRRALALAVDRLEERRVQAGERRARQGRVYGVLGLTAGAFLMILLI
ncbi:MAG: stage III sporulation protein AB [Candidatus Enterenecus sp.]